MKEFAWKNAHSSFFFPFLLGRLILKGHKFKKNSCVRNERIKNEEDNEVFLIPKYSVGNRRKVKL